MAKEKTEGEKQKVVLSGVEIPDWFLKIESPLLTKMAELKAIEEEVKELKASIVTLMKNEGIDRIVSGLSTVSLCRTTVTYRFDKERLKKDLPDIYKRYITETQMSPYIAVKLTDPDKADK